MRLDRLWRVPACARLDRLWLALRNGVQVCGRDARVCSCAQQRGRRAAYVPVLLLHSTYFTTDALSLSLSQMRACAAARSSEEGALHTDLAQVLNLLALLVQNENTDAAAAWRRLPSRLLLSLLALLVQKYKH